MVLKSILVLPNGNLISLQIFKSNGMQAMGRIYLFVFVFLNCCLNLFGQKSSKSIQYRIGENEITIVEDCYKGCSSKMLFINVHDNEQTSRMAVDSFLQLHGGKLIHIDNDSNRNISFLKNNHCFAFDPNRIYSREGRLATLTLLSDNTSIKNIIKAEKTVAIFAKKILQKYIEKRPMVVALHNNSDSNFSIKTYIYSQENIPYSGKTFVNPMMDEDDFILTSDKQIFAAVKAKKINVVWENVKVIKDDGSMSVYASKHGIPYINIEAEHGHFVQQLQMLLALEDIFRKYEKALHQPCRIIGKKK